MDQIFDRLWLGDTGDAERVTVSECVCVVTLCERPPQLTSPAIQLVHAAIPDEIYLPAFTWAEVLHCLQAALWGYPTVLVHCRLGVSRSPTLVALHMASVGWAMETALADLVSKRSIVQPHQDTWGSARDFLRQRMQHGN